MTRDDIHEAAESADSEEKGAKPGSGAERSEGGSGLSNSDAPEGGADAVPESTTGSTSPRTPNQSDSAETSN